MANIQEAVSVIAAADICGHVPLIKGPHGIGKSETSAQHAETNDMHYEPLILSMMDTGDMLGMPKTMDVGGMESTIWAAPSWYTNIVNAAWPNELKMERLQFADTSFQEYVLAQHEGAVIERSKLNTLYCEYYGTPNDTLQLLRQDNVEFLDARRSLLHLDEFNRAPMDILNASLQLILEHRMHSHILPRVRGQETLIVAAINPADGDYTVQEFDPALLDRFVECDVEPCLTTWLKFAKEKGVNEIVRNFLMEHQNRFHFSPKDGGKGTSPRTWTRIGRYLDNLEKTDPAVMAIYLKGTLGSAVAAQFQAYYNQYGKGVSIKDIIKAVKKEKAAMKKAGSALNPEVIAETVLMDMIKDMDAIRKMEFAESLITDFIEKDDVEEALPMLAYLYALPVENLGGVLKPLQTENPAHYAKLAKLDKEATGKRLFMKLVTHLKAFK